MASAWYAEIESNLTRNNESEDASMKNKRSVWMIKLLNIRSKHTRSHARKAMKLNHTYKHTMKARDLKTFLFYFLNICDIIQFIIRRRRDRRRV